MDKKSLEKPRKAQKGSKPEAQEPQSSKARVLTSKPDPKAQEPSPACTNTKPGTSTLADLCRRISPQPFDDMIAGQARHNLSRVHKHRTYGMHDEAGI